MKAGDLAGLRMVCPVFECGTEWDATAEVVNKHGVAHRSIVPLYGCKWHPKIDGRIKELTLEEAT
jgi:hypothetical protein